MGELNSGLGKTNPASCQSRSQSPQAFFVSGRLPGEALGNSKKKILIGCFRVTTYCFVQKFLAYFDSIVPESLQATNR